jgi:hypothetical protein
MTYGPDEASDTLNAIARGTVSFEGRARLEHHLLDLLRGGGTVSVSAFLGSLPGHDVTAESTGSEDGRLIVRGRDSRRLVITMYLGPDLASVNIGIEADSGVAPEPDPRHRAFYEIWEGMLGLGDSEVEALDGRRRAVFYVGLLEAEVMNGGFGQYLANTDGVHLDATLRCLAEIGAPRTAALLAEAVRVGAGAESYAAAWEASARTLERLDREFLAAGEDLAGLTADAFLRDEADGSV